MSEVEKIDILLAKYFAKEPLTKEEQQFVAEWKQLNSKEYKKIADFYTQKKEAFSVNTQQAWEKVLARKQAKSQSKIVRFHQRFLQSGIAASLLLFIGLSYWLYNLSSSEIEVCNIAMTNKTIALPDGSTVTLNRNTTLVYNEKMQSQRSVKLVKGEAFFEVKKDKKHPFSVLASNAKVEVLGTSFNVNMTTDSTVVAVKTGRVSVANKENKILLKAGEQGLLKNGLLSQKSIDNTNCFAWKERVLRFNNTVLKDAILQIANYYDVEIQIEENTPQCHFTTTFTSETLEQTLEELQILLDCNYKIEGKKVFLYDIKCK